MANLTAEDPDQLKCFRFAFTASSSIVCEFPITICNEYASIGGDVGVLCAPPPVIINGPNPPPPVIYSSSEQTCTVTCPDDLTTETYTVVAGTFVGLTQGEADAEAQSFACQLATLLCDGPLPPLFTNAAQTCIAPCPGGTASYTTPAGFFSALSQAEADFLAFIFACDVAALLCSGPPVGVTPGAGTPPPAPAAPLYANTPATCTATCPNGSVYVFTAPGGLYLRESRAAANAVALSYACQQAQLRRVCLSDLPTGICVGEFESAFVDSTGLAEPVTYTVTSGSLPPGMTLDQSGFFSGTPTTTGSYSFAITATGSDGQSTTRAYGISVAGIDQVVLAEATSGEPYLEILTQTGMGGAVTWALTDGILPDGITLNSDGVLEGTPTEDGDFPIEITITNGMDVCHRSFVLTVTISATPQLYWTLEGPAPAANHDEYTGDLLAYNSFGGVPATVPGKVNLGLEIAGGFCTTAQVGPTLAYTGPEGFSIALWVNYTIQAGFVHQWDLSGAGQFVNWDASSGSWQFAVQGVDISGNVAGLSTGAWHFIVFTYTHGGDYSFSVNGGALIVLGTPPVAIPVADAGAYMLMGNEDYLCDEVAIFPHPLDAADIAYLWNLGSGRTFPINFPP